LFLPLSGEVRRGKHPIGKMIVTHPNPSLIREGIIVPSPIRGGQEG